MLVTNDHPAMAADISTARAVIGETLRHFPQHMAARLSPAEVALARVRNSLIARKRLHPADTRVSHLMERMNLCLTLVLGMEYPQGSAKREPLEHAQNILTGVLADIDRLETVVDPV